MEISVSLQCLSLYVYVHLVFVSMAMFGFRVNHCKGCM